MRCYIKKMKVYIVFGVDKSTQKQSSMNCGQYLAHGNRLHAWGASWGREDSMHFEVSRDLVEKWIDEGKL